MAFLGGRRVSGPHRAQARAQVAHRIAALRTSRAGRSTVTVPARATLADVARRAGVSPSTASLALSGAGPVAPSTRERVAAVAAQLGYAPDPRAKSLRSGRTGVVAVIVGERLGYAFSDPMLVQLLDALGDRLGRGSASMLLVSGDESSPEPSTLRMAGLPMDAAVFAENGTWGSPLLEHLRRRGVVAVAIDGPEAPDVSRVWIDDLAGSALAVNHLAVLGHRDVGVLTLPLVCDGRRGPLAPSDLSGPRARGHGVPRLRVEGTLAAAAEVGMRLRFIEAGANVLAEGELVASAMLDGPADDRPTAIVAQSDVLALAVLRAADKLGLSVPDDLSVVGFDGVDLPLAGRASLTTVVQPFREKGTVAGDLVFRRLDGGPPESVQLPVELRVGSTTAGPLR
jgi:DNA-binding LacI/PurR family transcriptional regulator